jgi:hypothetical protein
VARRFDPPLSRTDPLANAALTVGILSVVGCLLELGVVLGPIAAIMGFISRKRIASSGGAFSGETRAMVGLVLGVLGFVASGLFILALSPGPWSNNGSGPPLPR